MKRLAGVTLAGCMALAAVCPRTSRADTTIALGYPSGRLELAPTAPALTGSLDRVEWPTLSRRGAALGNLRWPLLRVEVPFGRGAAPHLFGQGVEPSDVASGIGQGITVGYKVPALLHYARDDMQLALSIAPGPCTGPCIKLAGSF